MKHHLEIVILDCNLGVIGLHPVALPIRLYSRSELDSETLDVNK